MLGFIVKDGLLERFASHAPSSWRSLCELGHAAVEAGCSDESPYALLCDGEKLRRMNKNLNDELKERKRKAGKASAQQRAPLAEAAEAGERAVSEARQRALTGAAGAR